MDSDPGGPNNTNLSLYLYDLVEVGVAGVEGLHARVEPGNRGLLNLIKET